MSSENGELIQLDARANGLILTVAAQQLTALQATDEFDERVRGLLEERKERNWVLDFRSVTFMVTPAVNTIMVTHKRLAHDGGKLVITGLSDNIRHIFALMRLDEVLAITNNVDSALQMLES